MIELQERYKKEMIPALKKEFGYKNVMQVPTITKIVLNTCVSEAVKNPKILGGVVDDLTTIAGQKAVQTKAKKAISNFKLREGMPLGATVTLRRDRMWAFLERLVNISVPRVRDFRGLSPKGFDGRGNYNMGLKEQIVFPEIDYDKVDTVRGLNITICTTAKTDAEGRALLEQVGMPFRKK
ncbi:MAG: 50S ribosomal protein L5 [Bdellovibrionales bacterium]|nr:50S ribosomal protein L5 [Bdellovibrionales bacterium]